MATRASVSVAEYLSTSYHPDCEYVDGVVVERNLGEKDHSRMQAMLLYRLMLQRKERNFNVFPEQRVQVKSNRFRVPDICVVAGPEPDEQIFTAPPLVCVEILSPEDRWARLQEKVDEYLRFGVRYVWVIDPSLRRAWECTAQGTREVQELRTEQPPILVPLTDLFE